MKKRVSLALAVVLLAGAAPLAAVPAWAAGEPPFEHNIDYISDGSARVTATPQKDSVQTADPNTYAEGSAVIDLVAETLTLPAGFSATAFSVDGGSKWKAGSPPDNLAKLLNKNLELQLATEFDKKAKKPTAGKTASGDNEAVDGATVIKFPKIAGRPKAVKLAVNYLPYAQNDASDPGQWALTQKGATAAADVSALQVAVASSSKKEPDENGWGRFKSGQGINVKPTEAGAKPAKTIYLVRSAPVGGDGGAAKAASKHYKVTASGLLAQPKLKVSYAAETVKPKAGMSLAGPGLPEPIKIYAKGAPELKGVGLTDAIGADEAVIGAWLVATAKKPASRVQEITLAPRAPLPAAAEELTVAGGKLKFDSKKYEVWNSAAKKYGGLTTLAPKTAAIPGVRLKADAKASKDGTGYSGFAASIDGSIQLQWGKDSSDKDAILAAYFCPPDIEAPVDPSTLLTITPMSDITVVAGGMGSLNVHATTSETATLSYKWFKCDNASKANPQSISGATGAAYEIPGELLSSSGVIHWYYVEVTSSDDDRDPVTKESNAVRVGVGALPVINSQPQNVTMTNGVEPLTLSVTAASSGDGALLIYQWYSCDDASRANRKVLANTESGYAGVNTASLVIPKTTAAGVYWYFVNVTNDMGGIQMTVPSDAVKVTVVTTPAGGPVINEHPKDINVVQDETRTLSVTATATDDGTLSYQWVKCTNENKDTPTDVAGATSKTYTPPTDTAGDYYYFVRVTNTVPGSPPKAVTADSGVAKVTVT